MEILLTYLADGFASGPITGMYRVSGALSGLFACLYIMYWLGLYLWAFIEDTKVKKLCPEWFLHVETRNVGNWVYADEGTKHQKENWRLVARYNNRYNLLYEDAPIIVSEHLWGILVVTFLLVPVVLTISCLAIGVGVWLFGMFPIVITTLISGVGLVFIARAVRRLQKKVIKHINDIDAHKEGETQ